MGTKKPFSGQASSQSRRPWPLVETAVFIEVKYRLTEGASRSPRLPPGPSSDIAGQEEVEPDAQHRIPLGHIGAPAARMERRIPKSMAGPADDEEGRAVPQPKDAEEAEHEEPSKLQRQGIHGTPGERHDHIVGSGDDQDRAVDAQLDEPEPPRHTDKGEGQYDAE